MLQAGFSRVDITPPLGADLAGYFYRRTAKGVRDPLYANALALGSEAEKVILIAVDYIGIKIDHIAKIRKQISERTEVPVDHVMVAALHQHTTPCLADVTGRTALKDTVFIDVLYRKIADAAVMAVADMKDATVSHAAQEVAEPIAFVRRYFADDGSVQTNPDTDKYTLTGRCAEADNTVRVIRFSREGANDIALINFSTHPDVIGGEYISADWPGFTRKFVEQDISDVSAIFFTGCQGDSNHVDFFKPKGERTKFGDRYRHSMYMGRTVADAVKAVWDRTDAVIGDDGIFAENVVLYNRTNLEGIDEYDRYRAWYDDHEAGRLGYKPHITELAYASRIVRLRSAPVFHPVPLTVIGVGGLLFVGFGGEAFTAYGTAMRALAPDKFVVCSVCANGYEGYFPTEEAFAQGGYEAKSSLFTPTLEQEIMDAVRKILSGHGV